MAMDGSTVTLKPLEEMVSPIAKMLQTTFRPGELSTMPDWIAQDPIVHREKFEQAITIVLGQPWLLFRNAALWHQIATTDATKKKQVIKLVCDELLKPETAAG